MKQIPHPDFWKHLVFSFDLQLKGGGGGCQIIHEDPTTCQIKWNFNNEHPEAEQTGTMKYAGEIEGVHLVTAGRFIVGARGPVLHKEQVLGIELWGVLIGTVLNQILSILVFGQEHLYDYRYWLILTAITTCIWLGVRRSGFRRRLKRSNQYPRIPYPQLPMTPKYVNYPSGSHKRENSSEPSIALSIDTAKELPTASLPDGPDQRYERKMR